jgi:hypothetical protein
VYIVSGRYVPVPVIADSSLASCVPFTPNRARDAFVGSEEEEYAVKFVVNDVPFGITPTDVGPLVVLD